MEILFVAMLWKRLCTKFDAFVISPSNSSDASMFRWMNASYKNIIFEDSSYFVYYIQTKLERRPHYVPKMGTLLPNVGRTVRVSSGKNLFVTFAHKIVTASWNGLIWVVLNRFIKY